MICFICKRGHASANALIRHFKLVHGLCPGKSLKLKCAQRGCSHVYHSFSGLRKHLSKCCAIDRSHLDYGESSSNANSISLGDVGVLPNQNSTCESVLPKTNIENSCATVVAELKVVGVAETTINYVVSALEEVVGDVYSQTQESVKKSLSLEEPIKSLVESQIDQCFEKMQNPFVALNTESKRMQYFSDKWGKIDPVEYVLGTRFATRRNRTIGTFAQTIVKDKFVYIPIIETIQSIYKHPNIKDMMMRDSQQIPNFLYDIQDGELFKNHALFSKQRHAVQIQLFLMNLNAQIPLDQKREYIN
ncbi:uncharacterized protein LOC109615529 [Esox lucius]|uniref:uncharacterized protein LOC109615529 n=1 Tax=Esox lucius TaxID=8010 RepID=UPI001476F559|nr:uncharacterized protein LOC109615529 [Esox lucius]XP_028977255.2 uncharacterized protein LOC109615529 [Esox lucius]